MMKKTLTVLALAVAVIMNVTTPARALTTTLPALTVCAGTANTDIWAERHGTDAVDCSATGVNIANMVYGVTPTTFSVPGGSALPGTCTQGQVFNKTSGTSGQQFYLCESTNTWVLEGSAPAGATGAIQYNNAGVPGGFAMAGDCTISISGSTGTMTCAKTGGVSFAPSATTDTTNAANISSGTLNTARLPTPTTSTLGGVKSIASTTHNWITSLANTGIFNQSQPACSDLSGVAASCSTDTTNAANISSGTLPAARLPNPSASTLGGIQSLASVSHNWINSISTLGVPAASQPACGDLSNAAASCSTDATNAANISSGTVGTARLGSGTANSSTFLRGDNTWQTVTGTGTVTSVGITAGTGMGAVSGSPVTTTGNITVNSNAIYFISYGRGKETAIVNGKANFALIGKTSTLDSMVASAETFTCATNPTFTLYECGTDASCATTPTTMASVTVTSASTAFPASISSSTVSAGDYMAVAVTGGVCTAISFSVNAQLHVN